MREKLGMSAFLPRPRILVLGLVLVATAGTMMILDLLWLGAIARDFYDAALGPLKRPAVLWPAAALFYVFYVAAIVRLVVVPSRGSREAAKRGAVLGLVCYGTYELTNWAVIAGWPALLVPVDLAWGVFLTSLSGAVGRALWRPSR